MVMTMWIDGQRANLRNTGREWIALVNGEVIATGFAVQLHAMQAVVKTIKERHARIVAQPAA